MNNTKNKTASAMLGLRAQSSIHAGAGQRVGIVDLPIQREGHNGWPCIFGSSVKGAIRTHASHANIPNVTTLFGPEVGVAISSDQHHAGALMVSDARLLLYPVRSLTSQFKWITCPDAIRRFLSDIKRLHLPSPKIGIKSILDALEGSENQDVAEELAVVHEGIQDKHLFLEEYRFVAKPVDLEKLIEALLTMMCAGEDEDTFAQTRQALEKQLVIVSNDMFTYLVEHVVPLNPHITIDSETKTVKDGALWYEETLPPDTVMYVGVAANHARDKKASERGEKDSAEAILKTMLDLFEDNTWLQIGGNETLGMGWCYVSIAARSENNDG